jgi:hypothetical protein
MSTLRNRCRRRRATRVRHAHPLLVRTNFVDNAALVTLDGPAHVAVIAQLAGAGIGGGRTYDGLTAACAEVSRAKALLTFNVRHFDPPPREVTLVEPPDPS